MGKEFNNLQALGTRRLYEWGGPNADTIENTIWGEKCVVQFSWAIIMAMKFML